MNASDVICEISPWPLVVMVLFLVGAWRVQHTVNPIVVKVVHGLADQAGNNALTYGLMIGYGLSAGLQSLAEQATILHWMVVAAAAKVLNPIIVAMLAFAAKNSLGNLPTPKPPTPPTS